MKYFFILFCLILPLHAREASPAKIHTLYTSLNPNSISESLAFYQLYPNSPEGKLALNDAWKLLNNNKSSHVPFSSLPNITSAIDAIVALINKEPNEETPKLSPSELQIIDKLAAHLFNRMLAGHKATSEEAVLKLPPNEIDLARGLFLSQLGNNQEALQQIASYEAVIDLMALQVLTHLPEKTTHEQMIRTINHFVFTEMGFRFPPHSQYAKDIDLYTFLPSVLDSRRGVCLGVSILYLCLAQRLNLPLEMITPPGHIYVRYNNGKKIINIETTARGMDIESEQYLSIDTRQLQQRNIKEVIGFAHVNQASIYLQEGDYQTSLQSYLKAEPYLTNDMLLKELMGFNYLFVGNEEKGRALLTEVKDHLPDFAVTKDTMAEDYINGKGDACCIQNIFLRVDENRESIIKKREALKENLKKFPEFRAGISSLATTWLQLHRAGEALEVLAKAHQVDPQDPTTNYYLSALYTERMDYNKAWDHLRQAEQIVASRDHHPKALKELRQELEKLYPE